MVHRSVVLSHFADKQRIAQRVPIFLSKFIPVGKGEENGRVAFPGQEAIYLNHYVAIGMNQRKGVGGRQCLLMDLIERCIYTLFVYMDI